MTSKTIAGLVVVAALCAGAGLALARGGGATPYRANVAQLARDNDMYRRVLFTGDKSQLVVMSIRPGDDIGQETHARVEQTIVCVSGSGRLSLNGVESSFGPGDVVVIIPGARHDIRNVGTAPLKLYTIYVPPNHIDQRVQATKADAQADHEDEAFGRRVE
jgi:mannose-6-phosphate isomerase-like protein (cupin superfamily)